MNTGGPAGAAVARRLAETEKAPTVLLLEAGGTNTAHDLRYLSERFMTFTNPNVNWGYQTTPQKQLLDREIDYSRGKGLGGSSVINFANWTVGPREDYDRWARMVGDETFNWNNMRRRLKGLEKLRAPVSTAFGGGKYSSPNPEHHGSDGPLPIWYPNVVENGFMDYLDAAVSCGYQPNPDLNSGDPIGISVAPATGDNGLRWSSSWAFLQGVPDNLEIVTAAPVTRILLVGNRAVGVEANSKQCMLPYL